MSILVNTRELNQIFVGDIKVDTVRVRQGTSGDWIVVFSGDSYSREFSWQEVYAAYRSAQACSWMGDEDAVPGVVSGSDSYNPYLMRELNKLFSLLSHGCVPLMKQSYCVISRQGVAENLIDSSGTLTRSSTLFDCVQSTSQRQVKMIITSEEIFDLRDVTIFDLIYGRRSDPVLANLKSRLFRPLYKWDPSTGQWVPDYEIISNLAWEGDSLLIGLQQYLVDVSNELGQQAITSYRYVDWFKGYNTYADMCDPDFIPYVVLRDSGLNPDSSRRKSFRVIDPFFSLNLTSVEALDDHTIKLTFNSQPDRRSLARALSYVVPINWDKAEDLDRIGAPIERIGSQPVYEYFQSVGAYSGTIVPILYSGGYYIENIYPLGSLEAAGVSLARCQPVLSDDSSIETYIIHINSYDNQSPNGDIFTDSDTEFLHDSDLDFIICNSAYEPISHEEGGTPFSYYFPSPSIIWFLTTKGLSWNDTEQIDHGDVASAINRKLVKSWSTDNSDSQEYLLEKVWNYFKDSAFMQAAFTDVMIPFLPTPWQSTMSAYSEYDGFDFNETTKYLDEKFDLNSLTIYYPQTELFNCVAETIADSLNRWAGFSLSWDIVPYQDLDNVPTSSDSSVKYDFASNPEDRFTENKAYIIPYYFDDPMTPYADPYLIAGRYGILTESTAASPGENPALSEDYMEWRQNFRIAIPDDAVKEY